MLKMLPAEISVRFGKTWAFSAEGKRVFPFRFSVLLKAKPLLLSQAYQFPFEFYYFINKIIRK